MELVKTEANSAANHGTEYRKIHPLGKIPAFEGANGFNLSEVMAIAVYGKLLTSVLALFSFIPSTIRPRLFFHDESFQF